VKVRGHSVLRPGYLLKRDFQENWTTKVKNFLDARSGQGENASDCQGKNASLQPVDFHKGRAYLVAQDDAGLHVGG
jgi:hypothetical protein